MNYKTVTEEIKCRLSDYVKEHLTHSKGKNQYNCPFCGSGTGAKKTGAFTVYTDNNRFKCFSCGASGDIFDLAKQVESLPAGSSVFRLLCDRYGIKLENPKKRNFTPTPETPQADYTEFYKTAHRHISDTDYHRGLSKETLDRFMVGFVPDWQPFGNPKAPKTPRLIIPRSVSSYLARDTRTQVPEYQQPYVKQNSHGKISLFNLSALKQVEKPVYIVEGEIDAMSICDVGGEAVALCSTSNISSFLQVIREIKDRKRHLPPFIISLDDDNAGRNASKTLSEALQTLFIPFGIYNPHKGFKDANEALTANKDLLRQNVLYGMEHICELVENIHHQEQKEYLQKNSVKAYLSDFFDGVRASIRTEAVTTGFSALDSVLDGGLYEGLYGIGAISSLGKTTFSLQMADQIAENGSDVLIFSLEMSRNELIAKSLSRKTASIVLDNKGNMHNAKTARGILAGKRYGTYSNTEKELINQSVREYGKIAHRIFIIEAVGTVGADEVRQQVEEHIRCTGKHPVVIIDYLQILSPHNERSTDKQNTDYSVLQLKRLSRDCKIPIIVISSFNRDNYSSKVSMQAFKESGAIEYSTDVLIGLQLKGTGDKNFNPDEAKKKSPREIEAVILKNRNGATGNKIIYRYYPMFNYFLEDGMI